METSKQTSKHGPIYSKQKTSRPERFGEERRKEEEEEEKANQKTNQKTDKKSGVYGREKKEKNHTKRKLGSSCSVEGSWKKTKMAGKKNSNGSHGTGESKSASRSNVKTGQLQKQFTITPSCLRNLKERLEKITNVLNTIETKHMGGKPEVKRKLKGEREAKNLKSFKTMKSTASKAKPLSPSSSISSFQSGREEELNRGEEGQGGDATSFPIDDFLYNQQAKNYYFDTLSPTTLSPTRADDDGDARASASVSPRGGGLPLQKSFPSVNDLYSDFESSLSDFSSLSGRGENQKASASYI